MKNKLLSFVLIFLSLLFVCGGIVVKAAETEEEHTHTEEVVDGYDATCETDGLTFGVKCSTCGEVIQAQEVIPALGHQYGEWVVIKEATETEKGVKKQICTVCEKENIEEYSLEVQLPPVEVVYPCNVVIKVSDYGEILTDIIGGNVGDVVTVTPKPYSFCKVVNVTINGVDIIPNEDGLYQFVLVEGDNVLRGKFEIDSEQFKEVAQILADAKAGKWDAVFSIENLIIVIYFVISLVMAAAALINATKNKKIKAKTAEEISVGVDDAITKNNAKAINQFLNTTFAPIFEQIDNKMNSIDETAAALAKTFILSQENTPESRIAIINELSNLHKKDDNLAKQVKAIIEEEKKKNEEIQNKKVETIKQLEEANNELIKKVAHEDEKNGAEGRY